MVPGTVSACVRSGLKKEVKGMTMADNKREKLLEQIRLFNKEMDWEKFHTAPNIAKSISIEAGELLECFQWDDEYDLQDVSDELADVYSYVLMMADEIGIDLDEITMAKLEKTKEKYPAEKFKGISTKYNKL